MLLTYLDKKPQLHNSVFIASGAKIIGDVTISAESNIWYNTIVRGDVAPICIGSNTNIQDGSVIHTSRFNGPCRIGDRVTVGHMCLLHACNLHDDAFVGMYSTLMDNSVVESFGFLAANSLLTPGKIVKSYELWAGSPAKFIRKLNDNELFLIQDTPPHYIMLARNHAKSTKVEFQQNN